MGTRRAKMFLSKMTGLKFLHMINCPELTLSSLEAGIRAVPSVRWLWLTGCPKLPLMPPPPPPSPSPSPSSDPSLVVTADQDATFSVPAPPHPRPPPASTSPPLPMLRLLYTDDARLLTSLRDHTSSGAGTGGHTFRDHLLGSIRTLGIFFSSDLTALTAEEEEGLRALAPSLHCLVFYDCPNLRDLPADLRGILPNLKILNIHNCPRLRCLPDQGLPASLEFLRIKECPKLAERCLRGARHGDRRQQHEMAHVAVVDINGAIMQGSYRKFLELEANWDFPFR